MPLSREKAKCHHQILEGVGERTVWLDVNLGNLRRLHGISQWVTQNPKATITSRAAATVPKLLPAIPALLSWEKPSGEALIPPARRQLLAASAQGKEWRFSVLASLGKCQECLGVGMEQGGRGSDIHRAKKP